MPLRSPIYLEGLDDLVNLSFAYDSDNPTKYTEAFSFWCLRQVKSLAVQGFYWEQSTETDNALLVSQMETLRQGGTVDWGQSLLLPGGVLAAALAGLTMAGVMPATLAIQVGVELLCALFGAGGGKTDVQPIVDKMEEFHDLWRDWRGSDPFNEKTFAASVANQGTFITKFEYFYQAMKKALLCYANGQNDVSVLGKALLSGITTSAPESYLRSGLHDGSPADTEEGNATLEAILGRILADFLFQFESRGGSDVSVSVGNLGLNENP